MLTLTFTVKDMQNKPILMDHDGSADDFLSLILLLSMSNINILAVTLTPADCYIESALETTLKILSKANRTDIEIGIGHLHGINAFPAEWRAKPKILNALPALIQIDTPVDVMAYRNSKEVIIEQVLASKEPVTVLMTGPCSNLVQAIEAKPTIVNHIAEIVWMAGAFEVPGNVMAYNQNGTAEWNMFWDPFSAQSLLNYHIPITFIPLDVTNHVPVTLDFLKRLAWQSEHFWSDLAGQFWATTLDTIPAYEYTYFMWDVLATSFLAIPEAFNLEDAEIDIDTIGASAGRTYRREGSGQWASIATGVNKELFYDYLLTAFAALF